MPDRPAIYSDQGNYSPLYLPMPSAMPTMVVTRPAMVTGPTIVARVEEIDIRSGIPIRISVVTGIIVSVIARIDDTSTQQCGDH